MQLKRSAPALALFAPVLFAPVASAFYLPGVAPTSYKKDDLVPLHVNTIKPGIKPGTALDAPLRSVVSFDYYHPFFGFCEPLGGPKDVRESLGGVLFGDRIKTSPFELKMKRNESCKSLCEHTYNPVSATFVNVAIRNRVTLNWLVDGLPAGQRAIEKATGKPYYSPGFFLGEETPDGRVEFNNHYDIFVEYHEVSGDPNQLRVVGVLVEPSSLQHGDGQLTPESCERSLPAVVLDETVDTKVRFTYSVFWLPSKTTWATRMDPYFYPYNANIQWFSLVNSAIVVIFLVLTVISVLVRALKRDIARYNRLDQINLDDLSGTSVLEDGVQEDSGWKLVHGDVFRTPSHPLLLSVFLGSGAQIFVMAGFTLCFALLGFLSPSNRGALGSIMVILYTFLGIIGGYTSARVYKTLQGEKWKLNIVLTPLFIPGIVFTTFFFLNLFLWARGSSGAVPFTTMLVIILIWFVISVPLSFAGSWLGFRAAAIEPPVRTNQIPRQIPPATTYLKPIPSMLLVGILPFGAIFVELHFVMNSIWSNRIFYMFGFLFLCYGLMIITGAAVTILMVYFLLCSENYNWQWRSFLAAGTCGGYIFLNALIYWISNMSLSTLSGNVLYMGYSLLISFLFFILTGSIGYFASWWFVQKIYSSIKID